MKTKYNTPFKWKMEVVKGESENNGSKDFSIHSKTSRVVHSRWEWMSNFSCTLKSIAWSFPVITAADSEKVWISLNSRESKSGFPCESTIARSTKERRRAGFNGMSLLPGCGWGLWGKPCKPPCRGTSLPGPEEARSPVLICTYPYTGSCHWKGSTGELIGPIRKWERRTVCNW